MRDDRRADRRPGAGDDVHHAGRHTGLERQRAQPQGREGRIGRGLQNDRVAGRQRRRHLPRCDHEGEVPRHDQPDHADRLAQGEVQPAVGDRDGLAEQLVGGAGVILEAPGRAFHLGAGVGDRLAALNGFQGGQFVGVLADQGGQAQQHASAMGGARLRPASVLERGQRRPGGAVDVLGAAFGHVGDDLAGRGIGDLKRLPARRSGLLSADLHLKAHALHRRSPLHELASGE
jgi:hypothetical protein